jgi:AcrR family transcriptional regulator
MKLTNRSGNLREALYDFGVSQKEDIVQVALTRFARQGIVATSIQDIADHAHSSKANVLYHFTNKEHLVDHSLAPALATLENIVSQAEHDGLLPGASRSAFVERFIDFLLHHRLAVQIIVSHPYLADSIPALAHSQQLMGRLGRLLVEESAERLDLFRFGIAVSGATYALATGGIAGIDPLDDDDLRSLLTEVLHSTLHLDTPTTIRTD